MPEVVSGTMVGGSEPKSESFRTYVIPGHKNRPGTAVSADKISVECRICAVFANYKLKKSDN